MWFDQLEATLLQEAKQAGLLEHGTLIGTAREFLIKRVLKSILPPSIHIGTGKIIDAYGKASKQIDVVLFDSRFPLFEIHSGVGMYPIEGVIAVIEVKSTLTRRELFNALENTRSLINLTPGIERAPFWKQHIDELIKTGLNEDDAKRKAYFELIPASYIFSFSTKLRKRGLSNAVDEWFNKKKQPSVSEGLCAILPRAIVAGPSIGLLHDGLFNIDPGKDIMQKWQEKTGSTPKHIMSFWDTKHCFGWLAVHLIHTICARTGLNIQELELSMGLTII